MTDTTNGKQKGELHEFLNLVRGLYFVERAEVAAFTGGTGESWARFRENPARYMTVCSDEVALQIWRALQKHT